MEKRYPLKYCDSHTSSTLGPIRPQISHKRIRVLITYSKNIMFSSIKLLKLLNNTEGAIYIFQSELFPHEQS